MAVKSRRRRFVPMSVVGEGSQRERVWEDSERRVWARR
jgi:hypothetical protein